MAQLVPRVPIPAGHLSYIYYFFLQKTAIFPRWGQHIRTKTSPWGLKNVYKYHTLVGA